MKNLVVLTGAGISAESGISTFRDSNGLWENHDIMEVASIQGWNNNPQLVLDFYNLRRAQLKKVQPNPAHHFLVELEKKYNVSIITQNVDNLHEKAGSSHIIHLHGELNKVRSTINENLVYHWEDDLKIGDRAEDNTQLRPYIVWFGEMVPQMEKAMEIASAADIFIIIGTSLQVYPAASLIDYVPKNAQIICVDPNSLPLSKEIYHIRQSATQSINELKTLLEINDEV